MKLDAYLSFFCLVATTSLAKPVPMPYDIMAHTSDDDPTGTSTFLHHTLNAGTQLAHVLRSNEPTPAMILPSGDRIHVLSPDHLAHSPDAAGVSGVHFYSSAAAVLGMPMSSADNTSTTTKALNETHSAASSMPYRGHPTVIATAHTPAFMPPTSMERTHNNTTNATSTTSTTTSPLLHDPSGNLNGFAANETSHSTLVMPDTLPLAAMNANGTASNHSESGSPLLPVQSAVLETSANNTSSVPSGGAGPGDHSNHALPTVVNTPIVPLALAAFGAIVLM